MTIKPLSRQEKEVLAILRGCGDVGMNSYAWRTKYVQLPARIFGLKAVGYQIASRRLKNGSVNYVLISSHLESKHAPQAIQRPQAMRWEFDGGTARQVPVEPAKQGGLWPDA